ncbi:MAG TPA: hypothetical protein VK524_08855 [Polyangiaceae bacterium]|nr:hypothetical protein [Polyangiaceae bacterium]
MSKTSNFRFSAFAFVSLAAAGLAGCTAETLKEYEGEPTTLAVNYSPGRALYVEGLNGEIRLETGVAGEVQVRFKPFTFEGYTKEDEAREAIENDLHIALAEDSSGNVHATVTKDDGAGSLGAHMLVYLPPEFDDLIHIENDNGEIEVDFVAQANALEVTNDKAGDCLIAGQPTIRDTNVVCQFDVRVLNVVDKVNVRSEGIGDVTVAIASIAPGSAGGDIRTKSGNVNLTLPASSDFSVQASASGTVNEGALPSGCQVATAAANSKTVSCATGPNFTVFAGVESQLTHDVNLSYR